MIYLGVNTGTSADAIDCVACQFNEHGFTAVAGFEYRVPKKTYMRIMHAVQAKQLAVTCLYQLRSELTDLYINAIRAALQHWHFTVAEVQAIGLHGQTIKHCPAHKVPYTIQLGDGARIANTLKIPVVDQFRTTDIAVSGGGAPLSPAYHQYLAEVNKIKQAIFLNLGGIANITLYENKTIKGWDCGPANALLDLWCQEQTGESYDDKGRWAYSGHIIPQLLTELMRDPYFHKAPPKSTGRDYFSRSWLQGYLHSYQKESPEDVQATLGALTVEAICQDLQWANYAQGQTFYLFGKGIANQFVVEKLQSRMPTCRITTTADLGMPPDWVEGGLFAWLAYQYEQKNAVDLTAVTGAKYPVILGAGHHIIRV